MAEISEVIFTSSDGDKTSSANVWNFQTGTNLMIYKDGGACASKGLCLLGSDYVIAAEKNKPLLKIWAVNCQLPLNTPRLLCPGIVTTVAVNPDKCHIAVAVQEKLHLYSVSSGELLGTGARHFQPLRVLRWSSDGNLIVCGGEDGLVTVWLLSSLVNKSVDTEPLYVFSNHSLPVCDVYITPEGLRAYLISVSSDRTCKIYDLSDGSLLLSLVFDSILTAVCTNTLESDVFVGTNNGGILQFNLHSVPRTKEYHLNIEEKTSVFVGHTKSITCLSNSLDGELLLSGSVDETAKIWHIASKQCLRTINHKGQVTNAFFAFAPKQMFNHELKLSIYLSSFKKSEAEEESQIVNVFTNSDLKLNKKTEGIQYIEASYENGYIVENTNSLKNKDLENLRVVNKRLYKFMVNTILENNKGIALCKDDKNVESERHDEHVTVNKENGNSAVESGAKLNKKLKKVISKKYEVVRSKSQRSKKKKIRD